MRKLINFIEDYFYMQELKKYKDIEKILYILTPLHGNLGDQMIAVAGKKILSDFYPNKKIIEITDKFYDKNINIFKEIIKDDDIIILHGGGNLGDIWLGAEYQRRHLLENHLNNKIIIMPQTITFKSKEEEQKSKEIYSKVKDLTIITREEYSYELAKHIFDKNKILLMPDSVFYLEDYYKDRISNARNGILFLLRKDQEKVISSDKFNKICENLRKLNIPYKLSDTVIRSKGKIRRYNREKFCDILIDDILKSQLVITDRLHGMILAIITNTPVLVFNSSTNKTLGTLKWLKHLEYVSYISDEMNMNEILEEIKRLIELKIEKNRYMVKEKMIEVLKNI